MTLPSAPSGRTLEIYLYLAQYPILSTQIRARMRRELFNRGIISPQAFEAEVREKAILSQMKEGIQDPYFEEPADIWEIRLMRVRDHVTDFYFAYNLPNNIFEEIVKKSLQERGALSIDLGLTFNPELAPQKMLFDQAIAIEQMPSEERAGAEARLQEINAGNRCCGVFRNLFNREKQPTLSDGGKVNVIRIQDIYSTCGNHH